MAPKLRPLALIVAVALAIGIAPVLAGTDDYTFQPVSVDVRKGDGAELGVRLIHKPTGKLVDGAVLFRTRLDMSPEGMGGMTAKHTALPSAEPGIYRFRADLTMAGGWALKLMAKVPGESETVTGTVWLKAN